MVDNISNSNEQRQFSSGGGAGGASSSSMMSRKKTNNLSSGGDVVASPKYNKSNWRGYNKDIQQQKHLRAHNNNRGSRAGANSKLRNAGQNNNSQNGANHNFNAGLDDEEFDDDANEDFGFDEPYKSKRSSIGSGKANMSHLLNSHYQERQRVNARSNRRSANSSYYASNKWSSAGASSSRQTFSKEQFVQANCQFVVQTGSTDYSVHFADPDLAIDWSRVEQVRLHSMHPLKCPICLSEPQAAKITRCGHVYCWSCLLHYLALSDHPWRKCPVCAESIYKQDIRSVRGIVSRSFKPGDWITFRLMCRERGSVLFYPRKDFDRSAPGCEPERVTTDTSTRHQAHLLSADDETILSEIIERERIELLKQLEEDGDQPEACFIKQALEENNEREKLIQERIDKMKIATDTKTTLKQTHETKDSLLPASTLVYSDAFENIVEQTPEPKRETDTQEEQGDALCLSPDANSASTGTPLKEQSNLHYFYKADDIYHAYLNGLNTRILLHEYGSYQQCPDEIRVRVEAIESFFMTEDLRLQFRSLNHLPLTCEFQVIETRLHPPLISPATVQQFSDEIQRRRHLRVRKERLEKRRQQQAELAESQKLLSQYPPEMMYIPQESFPVNGTESLEEFPAMIGSAAASSPPSATVQWTEESSSPPTTVSFAQMLKQQAPAAPKPSLVNKPTTEKNTSVETADRAKKRQPKKKNKDSDEDHISQDDEYYVTASNFHSSFSLEEVLDRRLKLVTGEKDSASSNDTDAIKVPTKKKNKKNKQVLFSTGLGSQVKF